jgi:hypothetical protein
MTIRSIIALATAGFLVLGGVAFAASSTTSGSISPSPASAPHASTAEPAAGKASMTVNAASALPKALIGPAKSFHITDNKSLVVEDQAGGWFKLELAKPCRPLAKAESIRIAKSRTPGKLGSVVVRKTYCRIASFAETTAPAASSLASPASH